MAPNLTPVREDSILFSGCDLNEYVTRAGLCRSDDSAEKATELVKGLAEVASAIKKEGTQPDDTPKTVTFKSLLYDGFRFASPGKYDFCKPNIGQSFGWQSDSNKCEESPGYEGKRTWAALLTTNVITLCDGISTVLAEAIKENHLPACVRQAFYQQKERLGRSGTVLTEEQLAHFKYMAAACLNTMTPVWNEEVGEYELNYGDYETSDIVTGEPVETVAALEWICGGAMTHLLTKEELEALGNITKEPASTWPWGNQPKTKPTGVEDLEKCFKDELGVKWNNAIEHNKWCVNTVKEKPWAYTFAAIGGVALVTATATIIRIILGISARVAAFVFGERLATWLADGANKIGDALKKAVEKMKRKNDKKPKDPSKNSSGGTPAGDAVKKDEAPATKPADDLTSSKMTSLKPQPIFIPNYAPSWDAALDKARNFDPLIEPWQYYTATGIAITAITFGLLWEIGAGVAVYGTAASSAASVAPVVIK